MNDNQITNSHKDLKVLDILSESPGLSQREVAQKAKISLGMANIILKRLAKTGHIKISNLTARKMEYMLTAKGLKEKAQRTYQYILKTISTYQECQNRISSLIKDHIDKGYKGFAILGADGVSNIVELALKELMHSNNITFKRVKEGNLDKIDPKTIILDCRLGKGNGTIGVSLLSELIKVKPEHI